MDLCPSKAGEMKVSKERKGNRGISLQTPTTQHPSLQLCSHFVNLCIHLPLITKMEPQWLAQGPP